MDPILANCPLKGLVALVTGATSGIGLGIAHSLAKRGCNIYITGLGNESLFKQLREDFSRRYEVETHLSPADLSNLSEIETLHSSVIAAYPKGVDILVNNAGYQHVCPIEKFPVEQWNDIIAVMLSAPFHLTRLFLPYMKDRCWGRIINISSVHGLVASADKSAYVSAKHGLIGLTKSVAIETAGLGITCNAICPGFVETPLSIKQLQAKGRDRGITFEEAKAQMLDLHATKQPVTIEQVGEMAAFLCFPAADQMTGSSLTMDGGWTAK